MICMLNFGGSPSGWVMLVVCICYGKAGEEELELHHQLQLSQDRLSVVRGTANPKVATTWAIERTSQVQPSATNFDVLSEVDDD